MNIFYWYQGQGHRSCWCKMWQILNLIGKGSKVTCPRLDWKQKCWSWPPHSLYYTGCAILSWAIIQLVSSKVRAKKKQWMQLVTSNESKAEKVTIPSTWCSIHTKKQVDLSIKYQKKRYIDKDRVFLIFLHVQDDLCRKMKSHSFSWCFMSNKNHESNCPLH